MSTGRHAVVLLATAVTWWSSRPAGADGGQDEGSAGSRGLSGRLASLVDSARARLILERPISARRTRKELDLVRDEVHRAVLRGESPVVVFDIDDTILHSLRDPASGRRTGKTDPRPQPDQIEGAVAYAHELAEAGATLVYMTAKSAGSVEIVREQFQRVRARDSAGAEIGLPAPTLALYHDGSWGGFRAGVAESRHRIVFTEKSSASKKERLGSLRRQLAREGRPRPRFVAAFDNEKANSMMFARELPGARVFRVKTISKYRLPRPHLRHFAIRTIADFASRTHPPARSRRAPKRAPRRPR